MLASAKGGRIKNDNIIVSVCVVLELVPLTCEKNFKPHPNNRI